jgi:hypothetical protein
LNADEHIPARAAPTGNRRRNGNETARIGGSERHKKHGIFTLALQVLALNP